MTDRGTGTPVPGGNSQAAGLADRGDLVRASVLAGRVVLWEEVARDGAQHRTLLSGAQRVAVANATAALWGPAAPHHLVFAAGFPSAGADEYAAVRALAEGVETCHLVTHGRATRTDVQMGLDALAGARYGRVSFFVPVSEPTSRALTRASARETGDRAVELAEEALARAAGVPVDVALADASRADPGFVADLACRLGEAGVAVVKICDTVGDLAPAEVAPLIARVGSALPRGVALGVHLHNDYGLALASTLAALAAGVRVLAGSWLGLGERNGLPATEQLLLALAHPPARWRAVGIPDPGTLWTRPPDLHGVVPLARLVSTLLGVPLRGTDPHVGTHAHAISTGTPFADPAVFQPYDPAAVLGVPRTVLLTQLASSALVMHVAAELGVPLSPAQAHRALRWVKAEAFRRGSAEVPRDVFAAFLAGLEDL